MYRFSTLLRSFFKLLLSILLLGIFLYYHTARPESAIDIARKCYFHNGRNPNGTGKALIYFEDLLTSVKQPEYDQGIFFVETKCSDSGIVDIKPRFACSIESAAKGNPSRDAFVIFSSPVGVPRHEEDWPPAIKALMEYPNIHFRNVQLQRLCTNTPLENWIETSQLFNSIARYEHSSDIIRALTIYRYGGTYMDMDFMVVRRLDTIKRDWIAIQNGYWLNGAVFDFRRSGIGHIVMNEVLSDLAEDYKPDSWGHNGPDSFLRVMRNICQAEDLTEINGQQCRGATIYPPEMFYPLFGRKSLKFFDPNSTEEVLNKTKNMMGFHFWNSHSKGIANITMRHGSVYDLIAKKHCPLVYAAHEEF